MKTQKVNFVVAAALGGLLFLANVSQGQDTNATKRTERRGPNLQQRMERMTTELKLSDEQPGKVKALLEKQAKERRELVGDTALPREERRDKMRALMQEERKQLKTILSSEQFEKWQQLRQQNRARQPGKAGQDGGSTAAPAPEPTSPGKAK
jgi:Ribonuclease G/E